MRSAMQELTFEQLESVAGGLAAPADPEPWRAYNPYIYTSDPSPTPWKSPIIVITRPGG